VVYNVKAAVDGAIAWAEKKADNLSLEPDSTGPYTSQAMCVPSDLDPIAGGVLAAAMPEQNEDGTEESTHAKNDEDEKEKNEVKDEDGDDQGKNR
jgi:hypothetical protein